MAATAAIVGAVVAGAGATASYFEQKKAARRSQREQEKANRTAQASSQIAQARDRRRAIAQARMAQARNEAMQSTAVGSSSGLAGAQSGISTQVGANIGFQRGQATAQQQVFDFRQNASNIMAAGQRRANMWSTLGGLGQQGFNAYGDWQSRQQ